MMTRDEHIEHAYLAGGCFWGVEYYLKKLIGVVQVESGYMGGESENPTYEEVCQGNGHIEVVDVSFDKREVTYEDVVKFFMEIHDPTQFEHQGPDVGKQYTSVIFYENDQQKQIAEQVVAELRELGYDVVTLIQPASTFWKAEAYHQDYYDRKGTEPYCHHYTKRFN